MFLLCRKRYYILEQTYFKNYLQNIVYDTIFINTFITSVSDNRD